MVDDEVTHLHKHYQATPGRLERRQMENLETRFKGFLKALTEAGIKHRRNQRACCRSCVDIKNVGPSDPLIWSFGGQGAAVKIEDDFAYDKDGDLIFEPVYWYHQGLVESDGLSDAGQTMLDALDRFGFHYEWDKSDASAIKLFYNSSRERDIVGRGITPDWSILNYDDVCALFLQSVRKASLMTWYNNFEEFAAPALRLAFATVMTAFATDKSVGSAIRWMASNALPLLDWVRHQLPEEWLCVNMRTLSGETAALRDLVGALWQESVSLDHSDITDFFAAQDWHMRLLSHRGDGDFLRDPTVADLNLLWRDVVDQLETQRVSDLDSQGSRFVLVA